MKYECTDCKHCASFAGAYRIWCANPELSYDRVYKYLPLGDDDAEGCKGFDEDMCHDFTWEQLTEAEKYSEETGIEDFEAGIREWIDRSIKNNASSL